MAKTNSWAFPNIFDVAQNKVTVLDDDTSVANRCKLLILTDPTEVYNEPEQGVGIKRYLFQYNNDNTQAMLEDRIVDQFRIFEPYCESEKTEFSKGLLFSSGEDGEVRQINWDNKLELTIGVRTVYGSRAEIQM